MTQLLELRGVVAAPPDAVAGVLLDVRPGGRSPLVTEGTVSSADGDGFAVLRDGSTITVTVHRAARAVAQQGEWWYRGVTSVLPDARGSLVVHRIMNVAPGNRWAVRMASRGPLTEAPARFAEQLESLGRHLDCAAWVLD